MLSRSNPGSSGEEGLKRKNTMPAGGDIGIMCAGQENLRAYFEANAPSGDAPPLRSLIPGRLPEHETVYAMTVHKSQGSEFDDVLLILPPEESPLLTRELLYTAITRARKRVEIWAREDILRKCVSEKIARISGLRNHGSLLPVD